MITITERTGSMSSRYNVLSISKQDLVNNWIVCVQKKANSRFRKLSLNDAVCTLIDSLTE